MHHKPPKGVLGAILALLVLFAGCGKAEETLVDACEPITHAGDDFDSVVGQSTSLFCYMEIWPDSQMCRDESQYVIFEWQQVDGPTVEILNPNEQEASFVPTEVGIHKFRCHAVYPETEINRESRESQWDTVWVTVHVSKKP